MSLLVQRRILPILFVGASTAFSAFSPCSFNFGVDLKQAATKSCGYLGCSSNISSLSIPTGLDFVAMFAGHTDVGGGPITPAPQAKQEGTFLTWANTLQATPVWYTYIIAEGAKVAMGLSDCNMGSGKTLCTDGASYIKNNRSKIIGQYTAYAQFAASKFGTSKTMIWALEPDFYQYASSQNGNKSPLSFSDAASLISDIASAITTAMPNAQISMDISPWAPDNWFQALPLSKFKYMNTSGGVSQPGSTIASGNNMTWAHIHQLTGLPIIADDGYGTGGTLTGPNSGWTNASNLKARYSDGVIGLMEAYPGSSWTNTISGLRNQLPQSGSCHTVPKYTLTVTAGTGGTVTSSPVGSSLDSGTVVILKATALTGYTFQNWSGSVSGTTPTIQLGMNANNSVTATFAKTNAIIGATDHDPAVRAQLLGNQLLVQLTQRGVADFSLVSIDGKSSLHLGQVDLQGQNLTISLGPVPVGLHLLKVRGQDWQAVVPLAVLAR